MGFKITARTILHLGAELISSDAIAFYELIKNAFDAKSKKGVDISVTVRIPHDKYLDWRTRLLNKKGNDHNSLVRCRNRIIDEIDFSAPQSDELVSEIKNAASFKTLLAVLNNANFIIIKDTGHGMSLVDLDDIYLTIGTRSRLQEKEKQIANIRSQEGEIENAIRPILGEKGLGRLSVMRLGNLLNVETSKEDEKNWNLLEIDWNIFKHESADLLETIKIEPKPGARKESSELSGTTVKISSLTSAWSEDKLMEIAKREFSKLTDPFVSKNSKEYPIKLKFNDKKVSIPPFDEVIYSLAHAVVEAEFSINNDQLYLAGSVDYKRRKSKKIFSLSQIELLDICSLTSPNRLKVLGPFKVKFYWFNRRLFTKIDGLGDKKYISKLVEPWTGGIMVFRDGFRVNPYGSPSDDWLDLDRIALASSGYKVNRRQIMGKLDITSFNNPSLVDQTNREGLRDCSEKGYLKELLLHIVLVQFKTHIEFLDDEYKKIERASFDDLEERVEQKEEEIKNALDLLINKYPEIKRNNIYFKRIEESVAEIENIMGIAKELADSYVKGEGKYLHLAGIGLMTEIIAHELNRTTRNTLKTLQSFKKGNNSESPDNLFNTLASQLRSIQKRLKILDPLSTRGRQVKEEFDLVHWVGECIETHDAQFERHDISCNLFVIPIDATLQIKAVKGMIVQVLENLIDNSAYWLKYQKRVNETFKGEIDITINVKERKLYFTDNGPGIDPSRKEEVFQPFFSTKPIKEGKGMGLYISREIAGYNDAQLYLLESEKNDAVRLSTFVLELPANP